MTYDLKPLLDSVQPYVSWLTAISVLKFKASIDG